MLYHNTSDGDFHNGPEKSCPKCTRRHLTLAVRKARGHKGGKKTASQKPTKKLVLCRECGVTMKGKTKTGLCRNCYFVQIKTRVKTSRVCSDCGKPITVHSTGRCRECARNTPEQIQHRSQLFIKTRELWKKPKTKENN